MRVISSVLSSSLTLPSEPSTGGNTAAECIVFGDGYSWGSVRLADVKIGGETASNVPIQVIGDLPESSVPSDCSSAGSAENTVATFGYYGLLGINHKIADCGNSCENPTYYSCSASTCTATTVAVANQVSNPVASFGKDGNGVIVEFPAVPAGGAATLTGSLVFGIGTETNNGLGSASVLTIDEYGYFSTLYKGVTLPRGFLDSGSSVLYFDDSTITQCSASSMADGYYCPTSTLSLSAQNIGKNSVTSTVSFSVGNADMLLSNPAYEAFDDLGGPEGDSVTFDWGFPFFVGRNVYVAFDGATTPGGTGPYFAY
jgi:hypothetical protein